MAGRVLCRTDGVRAVSACSVAAASFLDVKMQEPQLAINEALRDDRACGRAYAAGGEEVPVLRGAKAERGMRGLQRVKALAARQYCFARIRIDSARRALATPGAAESQA